MNTAPPLDPQSSLQPLLFFCGLILAFLYFCLGWATNRLKDHESQIEKGEPRGDPILICWASATGTVCFTFIGLGFYATLFFSRGGSLHPLHALTALLLLVPLVYFCRYLFRLLRFHGIGSRQPPKQRDPGIIAGYQEQLPLVMLALFFTGCAAIVECCLGEFLRTVLLVCFLACGVAGLGACICIQGDLLERAQARGKSPPAALPQPSPPPAAPLTAPSISSPSAPAASSPPGSAGNRPRHRPRRRRRPHPP